MKKTKLEDDKDLISRNEISRNGSLYMMSNNIMVNIL